jgi:hypothetical protein
MLNLTDTADPIGDYPPGERMGDVAVLVPGHGSIGGADQVQERIDQDRAYVHALLDADVLSDLRVDPSDVWQGLAARRARTATPAPHPKKRARRDARPPVRLRNTMTLPIC